MIRKNTPNEPLINSAIATSSGKAKPTKLNKKISYKMVQGMLWLASSTTVKGHWKKHFGRLPKDFGNPYERISASIQSLLGLVGLRFLKNVLYCDLYNLNAPYSLEQVQLLV